MSPKSAEERDLLIHDVARANRNAVTAALARQGLQDVGQPRVLILLSSLTNGTVNQRSLADALRISPATMANSLRSLEQKGYVSRITDPQDSRAKLVSITKKGVDAVQRCTNAFDMVNAQAFSGFSQQERATFQQMIRRMLANLYAIGGNEDPEDEMGPPLPPAPAL